jgi:hypothetical protein
MAALRLPSPCLKSLQLAEFKVKEEEGEALRAAEIEQLRSQTASGPCSLP